MSDPEIERRFKRIRGRIWQLGAAGIAFFLATIALLIRFGVHLVVR